MAAAVESSEQLRWLEVCCSLASGRGDEHSDIDAGVGYSDGLDANTLDDIGSAAVRTAGKITEMLVHVMPGWPVDTRRFAVEFDNDLQLDLVFMPSKRRVGLPTGAVAVVDKDGHLDSPWSPPAEGPPSEDEAREWLMLGWWALSDVAKYLSRRSLFEAIERLVEARQQALKLYAVGRQTPFPSFGLVSLLDFHPHEVPEELLATYARPESLAEVASAAVATADLLDAAAPLAEKVLGCKIATYWATIGRRRLAAAREVGDERLRGGAR